MSLRIRIFINGFINRWSLFGLLFFLLWSPHQVATATGIATEWQAEFFIRVLSPKVKEISSKGKLYRKGHKIRIEPHDSNEIFLYDTAQSEEIRIFPQDELYFLKPLLLAKQVKGMKEGWVSPHPPFEETQILFREDFFRGVPAKLYFVTLKRLKQKAYLFRWMSTQNPAIPLRVIYPGTARETIIVDFKPLSGDPPPADFFDPPPN